MSEPVVEERLAWIGIARGQDSIGDGPGDDHPLHALRAEPLDVSVGIERATGAGELESHYLPTGER